MLSVISQFRGPYFFLSNYFESPFTNFDNVFPTVEHYFHWMKADHFEDDEVAQLILKAKTPDDARRLGRKVKGFDRENWEAGNRAIMHEGLKLKFTQNSELRVKLKETAPHLLVEGNTWGDAYWGYDLQKEKGKNWLGILLMGLRNDL